MTRDLRALWQDSVRPVEPSELARIFDDPEAIGAISPAANRSAAPSGLSRQGPSQAKPAATIAGALADLRGLAIGMASAFAILLSMRGTL